MPKPIERRQLFRVLAAVGMAVPLDLAADVPSITAADVAGAARIAGEHLADDRLPVIAAAAEKSRDQFQMVRDFEIEESVAPATVFIAG